ncbi:Transposable element Tc1 transposase, partial [Stegodyphus mimosarum]
MSAAELNNLVCIDSTMNNALYLNILKDNLGLSAQNLDTGNNFIFHQDNDSKHTALNVRLLDVHNYPQLLKTPLLSPNLNPTEHIWRELEVRVP